MRIAAPPLEGRANEALIAFVAESLRLPRRAVRVVRGESGRDKVLEVDLDASLVEDRLKAAEAVAHPTGAGAAGRDKESR